MGRGRPRRTGGGRGNAGTPPPLPPPPPPPPPPLPPFKTRRPSPTALANRNKYANALRLVEAYRTHGHVLSSLNPLAPAAAGQKQDSQAVETRRLLNPALYGLTLEDTISTEGIVADLPAEVTVAELIATLDRTYSASIGYEFTYLPTEAEREWFASAVERLAAAPATDAATSMRMWERMMRSEVFDQFMTKRFAQVKRYGCEGIESMHVGLEAIFEAANRAGVSDIVLGMPHRGRLNLLTDLMGLPAEALFHKLATGESELPPDAIASGDVLSHIAASVDLAFGGEGSPATHISMLHNPSHLEAVNPVTTGKARAKLTMKEAFTPGVTSAQPDLSVLALQVHGDSAFAGQGVVPETLLLANIPHYTTYGSVHVVVNNQVGFTTQNRNARSTRYASDVAKSISAPVIHVNAEDPEAVRAVFTLATEYRQTFGRDVVLDLIGFRRWGHNELDEPAFTQPLMYADVRARESVVTKYERDVILAKGHASAEELQQRRAAYEAVLDAALDRCRSYVPPKEDLAGRWTGIERSPACRSHETAPVTGVPMERLLAAGRASVTVPDTVQPHDRLVRTHLRNRLRRLDAGEPVDWATAEAMAFGTLLADGQVVRLSGQDVGRGTFSHRHAMLVDQTSDEVHVPLNSALLPALEEAGVAGPAPVGRIELANSPLSELAVLGFEYGHSLDTPNTLTLWEAQFGDFWNTAQVMVDTFTTCSETKWLRQSSLTMLLPHGYDGTGPEHSSSRIERFLQLSDEPFAKLDGNMPLPNVIIANPTTPAQYFHILRRQQARSFRKPLVLATPKTLLRLPAAVSPLEDLTPASGGFKPVLADPAFADGRAYSAERVLLCSGKLYYELVAERARRGLDDKVAIVRVEELSPFPFDALRETLDQYSNAVNCSNNLVWVQEEHQNQGPWTYVQPRINSLYASEDVMYAGSGEPAGIRYVGRAPLGCPATGISKVHQAEVAKIYEDAFTA
ncbi:oxoglutarate dehydrogenase (succinyl-transferring), E1 component [Fonticula alba]|uniref:Oxoglutarate dehydrogenase (Succinyl-transferring), E1 component n=1 Tax=Fonticula alba TaxID=691883 RepID=A0A058Z9Q9_FONAL|nr:oxoglutarate dehydrogenase (succinyl-transferring), E1 component [Fonticula alba]KCV70272.1 oxoglutarate dehydrogenase (succinyl-transferring), E1 component [Fonticula alba]|eukprot:XP_009494788.1 oxoglutarate dehydrogenase (succinyl-transferring), E1 component [Fonticula alba]